MDDEFLLRQALQITTNARQHGNHPFGALLVNEHGSLLLEAENTVVTTNDCTGHAETNLMRLASQQYSAEFLSHCSLYTSTEPCPMCAAAIFWGNVHRLVFGLSQGAFYRSLGCSTSEMLPIPCRELFARGSKHIEVVGPLLEDEALAVHAGFWE